MKILVTGARGQLGRDVVTACGQAGYEVLGCDRETLDITNASNCRQTIQQFLPDVIIHCAAYTAVDQAETDIDGAYLVNSVGTRNIAVEAEKVGAKLIFISTDYVFDGHGTCPYHEYDNTDPKSIYGKSKRAGEMLVESLSSKFFIVRTSWVFGIHGTNFVKTMLKLGSERSQLKVVSDQVGSPTFTEDLADFLLKLIVTENYGIYHASNTGTCSWYDFAKAIFEQFNVNVEVLPCSTEEFPRPAPRPSYSVMEQISIRTNGFEELPSWRDALTRFQRSLELVED